jgi:hypothetical protein
MRVESSRARLGFRASVYRDQHWTLSREPCRRSIQETGDRFAVETFPRDQFGRAKILGGDLRFALCPALDLARRGIQRIRIARALRVGQREREIAAVPMPANGIYDARRHARHFPRRSGFCEKVMQHTQTALVGDEGDVRPVARQVEFVHVPGNIRREVSVLLGGKGDVGQAMELRIAIGGDIKPLAVLREFTLRVRDFVFHIPRRECGLFTRRCIHQPEIRLIDR